jgi:hypothetical protein
MLAVALDLQELEEYHFWILSQQDPKKFQWSSSDHAGTQPLDKKPVNEQILAFGQALAGGNAAAQVRSDIWEYGKVRGAGQVFEAMKWDEVTGQQIGIVYIDQDGAEVDVSGYVLVKSNHEEARAKASSVFENLRA